MTSESPEAPVVPPKRRFRMSPKKWLIVALAVVLLAGAGVGSYLLLRPTRAAGAQAFSQTAEATVATQTLTVGVDGTLSPRKASEVNYSVSGTVTKVYVKAGDTVKKNQVLARIDNTSLADAVDLAAANLDAAEASLDEAEDNDSSDSAINAASAQVDSASAALSSAKENLADAVLRSPIAGTVASVSLEVGDTVGSTSSSGSGAASSSGAASTTTTSSTSSAQFVVISASKWKLEGSVGAADLASLKAGQEAKVTANGTEIDATVASVGIVATSTSDGAATFPIVLNLSGTHTDLFSGTTATAVITTGSYPDVLTVPTQAITTKDGATVVTKISDGATTSVEVEVGRVFGSNTEVTSGLAEGDQVQITFSRPSSTSTSTTSGSDQGGFGGLGGITGGGGAPPNGGGAPPAGGNR